MAGYSPWGHKELDAAEGLSMHACFIKMHRQKWWIFCPNQTFAGIMIKLLPLEPVYPRQPLSLGQHLACNLVCEVMLWSRVPDEETAWKGRYWPRSMSQ